MQINSKNMSLLVTEEDIDALRRRLVDAFGEGYEVETNKEVCALMGFLKETFDLVLFYHGDAICGIEYKYKAGGSFFYDRIQDLYIDKLKNVGLKYGIAYSGERQKLYFWSKGAYQFDTISFDDMVTAIKDNKSSGERLTPDEIKKEFKGFVSDKWEYALDNDHLNRLLGVFNANNLEYDEKCASMWLKTDAEDKLFKLLLKRDDEGDKYNKVCRYTSLNSLFLTMKEGNHVMCSITCMNDKGEIGYADKYVGYGAFASSASSIKDNNDCFILSCCNQGMADNLTMWRLYGNDGKGVCLEYEIDMSKIDNREFFFAPVSYGEDMKDHPVLDFTRDIRHWKKNGWCFELKRWYIWKHFFKSYLFKEENEVRLLYIWTENSKEKVDWIMDSTNNIASRICKFPITKGRLPLTLTNAIIGPKCPEQGSNVDQFNYMNRLQKIMKESMAKPAVRASKIEDYR